MPDPRLATLSDDARAVLSRLRIHGGFHSIDMLQGALTSPEMLNRLLSALSELELAELIEQLPGKQFRAVVTTQF